MTRARITGLFIHPVKSMRALAVDEARLTPTGLAGDRHWMVVGDDGRFVTQRECPGLATIDARLEEGRLVLAAAGQGEIGVPRGGEGGARVRTEVWGDACEALSEGREVGAWLTAALASRRPLRLVRMAPGYRRPQRHPDRFGADTTTVFADSAPLLIASEASLEALNRELRARGHDPVPMDRFRPNVVVAGLPPLAEHGLRVLAHERYRLGLRYPRERCVVTTLDQRTGQRDPAGEPFRTLRDFNPMPGSLRAPAFAQLAVIESGSGARIAVGDRLVAPA